MKQIASNKIKEYLDWVGDKRVEVKLHNNQF